MPPVQCATATTDLTRLPTLQLRLPRVSLAIFRVWMERVRQRRALADLDDRLLADIGLTRRQALAEACKPFWRA